MKTLLLLCTLLLCLPAAQSQPQSVAGLQSTLATEKEEDRRIDLLVAFFNSTADIAPLQTLHNQEALLQQARAEKDGVAEALALSHIGYCFRSFGNTQASFEYALKGDDVALRTGNERCRANTKMILAFCYKDIGNAPKAISLLKTASGLSHKLNYPIGNSRAYENLAELYLPLNTDSALYYAQLDYQLGTRMNYTVDMPYVCLNLANIWSKKGNDTLAGRYYNRAAQLADSIHSAKILNWVYTAQAQHFRVRGQRDSALLYARKAIAAVQATPFDNYNLQPAKLLLELYRETNVDSAFKYSEMNRLAADSVFNTQKLQQVPLMAFENDLSEAELAVEKARAKEERQTNIQYVLMGLGIVVFITVYLLVSHTVVAHPKVIEFLGVLALLIVFEFLNLLLHSVLEKATHHSPLLLLLSLVCIAALLVPLHHKAEHWAVHRLVAKNKALRMAAAQKEKPERE